MAEQRREVPATTEFHDDQVMRTRLHRYDRIKAIGVEHNLSRSYSTVEECRTSAKAVFSGSRVVPSQRLNGTTRPGRITDLGVADGVYSIGGDDTLIDDAAVNFDDPEGSSAEIGHSDVSRDQNIPSRIPDDAGMAKKPPRSKKSTVLEKLFSRPENLKVLK